MESTELHDFLRKVANKLPSELTANDKQMLTELAAKYGVSLHPRGNCKMCYIDAAVILYNKLTEKHQKQTLKNDPRRFVLKAGVDVYFGGLRVNDATLTDALAEKILKRGFDKRYFAKYDNIERN